MWFGFKQPVSLGGALRDIQKTAAKETTDAPAAEINPFPKKFSDLQAVFKFPLGPVLLTITCSPPFM